MMVKHTVCPSCSAGCGVNLIEIEGSPVGTYPYKRHPVNEGKTCRPGRECHEIPVKERITPPAIKKSGALTGAGWEDALSLLADKLSSTSPEQISVLATGTLTDEEAAKLGELTEKLGINAGVLTGFPEFSYPEVKIEKIKDYKSIAVIGDPLTCAPLIGRRIFHAAERGAEVRSYDTRDSTRMSLNFNSHIRFSGAEELVGALEELPEGSLLIITPEIPGVIGSVVELADRKGLDVIPILEDFNTRGVMKHLKPLSEPPAEAEIVWLIDPGAEADHEIRSDFLVLQSIRRGEYSPDVFIPTAAWCEKSGSYTNALGYTQRLEPALPRPAGVLTDGEIFERISDYLER